MIHENSEENIGKCLWYGHSNGSFFIGRITKNAVDFYDVISIETNNTAWSVGTKMTVHQNHFKEGYAKMFPLYDSPLYKAMSESEEK